MSLQHYTLQQSNNQQQGQQNAAHSTGPMNYFLSRPPSGPSYSPGKFRRTRCKLESVERQRHFGTLVKLMNADDNISSSSESQVLVNP